MIPYQTYSANLARLHNDQNSGAKGTAYKIGSARFRKTFKTITVDNGGELMDTVGIEKSCKTKGSRTTIYYCHPYSSWKRGSNENANSLIRRFIPKGTPIENYTDKQILKIEQWINNYPRKILGYQSANMLYQTFTDS